MGTLSVPEHPQVRQGRLDSHDALSRVNQSSAEVSDASAQGAAGEAVWQVSKSHMSHCTSSAHMDKKSVPKTESFQQLCTALQQQRAATVTRGLNARRAEYQHQFNNKSYISVYPASSKYRRAKG